MPPLDEGTIRFMPTHEMLVAAMDSAVRMPGVTNAYSLWKERAMRRALRDVRDDLGTRELPEVVTP